MSSYELQDKAKSLIIAMSLMGVILGEGAIGTHIGWETGTNNELLHTASATLKDMPAACGNQAVIIADNYGTESNQTQLNYLKEDKSCDSLENGQLEGALAAGQTELNIKQQENANEVGGAVFGTVAGIVTDVIAVVVEYDR